MNFSELIENCPLMPLDTFSKLHNAISMQETLLEKQRNEDEELYLQALSLFINAAEENHDANPDFLFNRASTY